MSIPPEVAPAGAHLRLRRTPRRLTPSLAAIAAALAVLASTVPADAGAAGLSFDEALAAAEAASPALRATQAALAGATAAQPAAGTLPDPRLAAGIENLPANGMDRFSTTRDGMTMQRLALMQDVPNRGRRAARERGAAARVERERANVGLAALAVRRDTALAWLAVFHAERRAALLAEQGRVNRLLQDTLPPRVAAGRAMTTDWTMARQEALELDDRADELARDVAQARAELRRWVGERAGEPLAGAPPQWRAAPAPGAAPTASGAPGAAQARAGLEQHAELRPYAAMHEMARAEMDEARAEERGDWSWEIAYSRRPRYDDMISFQLRIDLPWQRASRQQPLAEAKRREAERIEAEREEALRRHGAELDALVAELGAVQRQLERLQGAGHALAEERVTLATAAYEAGRADLGGVLAARSQRLALRLRAIELEAKRDALQVRLEAATAQ